MLSVVSTAEWDRKHRQMLTWCAQLNETEHRGRWEHSVHSWMVSQTQADSNSDVNSWMRSHTQADAKNSVHSWMKTHTQGDANIVFTAEWYRKHRQMLTVVCTAEWESTHRLMLIVMHRAEWDRTHTEMLTWCAHSSETDTQYDVSCGVQSSVTLIHKQVLIKWLSCTKLPRDNSSERENSCYDVATHSHFKMALVHIFLRPVLFKWCLLADF